MKRVVQRVVQPVRQQASSLRTIKTFQALTPWIVRILDDLGPRRSYPKSVAELCRYVFKEPGAAAVAYDVRAKRWSLLADALVTTDEETCEMSDCVVALAASLYPVRDSDFEWSQIFVFHCANQIAMLDDAGGYFGCEEID